MNLQKIKDSLKRVGLIALATTMFSGFNSLVSRESLEKRLYEGGNILPTWSPDGKKIAFSSMYMDYDICVMNADGSERKRIINNYGDDLYPSWSPDGKIIFTNIRHTIIPAGEPMKITSSIIFIADSDGSNIKPLFSLFGSNYSTFSPDGEMVAFVQERLGNVVTLANPYSDVDTLILTEDYIYKRANNYNPSWSSDGKIAFSSNRDVDNEIYIMNLDGSKLKRLTKNSFWDYYPKLSVDGKEIAFVSSRDGNNEIYVMDSEKGKAVRRLTNNSANDLFPAWSFDGKRIVFSSDIDGDYEIYVMNKDGSNKTRLTFPEENTQDSNIKKLYAAFSSLEDINGAIYDRETNRPIIFGEVNNKHSPVPMNLDDLINSLWAVKENEHIGLVNLPLSKVVDPTDQNLEEQFISAVGSGILGGLAEAGKIPFAIPIPPIEFLSYLTLNKTIYTPPQLSYTNLGEQLSDSELVLYALMFGSDDFILVNKPIQSSVEGYKTLDKLVKETDDKIKDGILGIIGLTNQNPQLIHGDNIIYIQDVSMSLDIDSPYLAVHKFASHFMSHYDEFANEKYVFKEILRTARLFSIAKWLVDLNDYDIGFSSQIPNTAPYRIFETINNGKPWTGDKKFMPYKRDLVNEIIKMTKVNEVDGKTAYLGLEIGYNSSNIYLSDENSLINGISLRSFKDLAMNARPHKDSISWDFVVGDKTYKAIALPPNS